MVARVTLAEVDAVRTRIESAIELYKASVLPAVRRQAGYEGTYVLVTAEGKALVMTLWTTEQAAEQGLATGFYGEQVEKFVTFFRAPPGRESYEVVVIDRPDVAPS
jgi:heme-degrading monooxygenase HmoA